MTAPTPAAAANASPLSFPVFRALWIATIISNIGTWMHDVGAGWLMTSLSPSPLLVALVQAATTLPMFLLALPAGALADIVDRLRMLLAAQLLGLVAAAILAVATWQGLTTPYVLLAATFVLGVAAALSAPVFQAIVPELVDQPALPDAVALNSLGVNISRAIGPALGGVIVALAGTPAVFALNALSVLAVLFVLFRWQRPATARAFLRGAEGRLSLCPLFPAAAPGPHPRRRLLRLRQRALGHASAGRPARARPRRGGIRRAACLHGCRRGRRRAAAEAAAQAGSGQHHLRRRDAAVRRRNRGAGAGAQRLGGRRRHVRGRPCLDRHADVAQRRRADGLARLGEGAGARRLSAGVPGHHDRRQHPVGRGRVAHGCLHRARHRGRRPCRGAAAGLCLAAAEGHRRRPRPLQPLGGAGGPGRRRGPGLRSRRAASRSTTRAGARSRPGTSFRVRTRRSTTCRGPRRS